MPNPNAAMSRWAFELMSGRNVGHTQLMIEGLKHFEGKVLLVAATKRQADLIAQQVSLDNDYIQIETCGLDMAANLRGQRIPVAFDNSALRELFRHWDIAEGALDELAERLKQRS